MTGKLIVILNHHFICRLQETAGQTIRPILLTPSRRSSTPPGPKMMMPRSSGEYQSIRPREPSSIVPSPSAMSSPSVMSSQCNMSSPLAVQSMEEGNSGNYYESSTDTDANLVEDRLPSNNDHEDRDVSGNDDQIAALMKSC